jgi:hypothetical protein
VLRNLLLAVASHLDLAGRFCEPRQCLLQRKRRAARAATTDSTYEFYREQSVRLLRNPVSIRTEKVMSVATKTLFCAGRAPFAFDGCDRFVGAASSRGLCHDEYHPLSWVRKDTLAVSTRVCDEKFPPTSIDAGR